MKQSFFLSRNKHFFVGFMLLMLLIMNACSGLSSSDGTDTDFQIMKEDNKHLLRQKEHNDAPNTVQDYVFTDHCYIYTPYSGSCNLTPVKLDSLSCAIIECSKGDVFIISGSPRANSGTRPYAFLDKDNQVLYRSNITATITEKSIIAPSDGKLIVNFFVDKPHSVRRGTLTDFFEFINEPLTNLPDYILNNLAYKPIGSLEQGYICLSCDDGAVELAEYTIPMLLKKEVPCTFALFSKSAVFKDYTELVVDVIKNHGCELAQHGNQNWAEGDGTVIFTESKLTDFFDSEKEFWNSLGLVPKSAVCPSHHINALVKAVAGGRFGVVRSGLDYVDNHYIYYLSGPRSNLYGLSSQNINGGDLSYWKKVIDTAYEKHRILNIYWHDYDLTDAQKAVLEATIDYAKTKGIKFCTIGQIPHLL